MMKNKLFIALVCLVAAGGFVLFALHYLRVDPQANAISKGADFRNLVRSHSPVMGNSNARVTIVEFLDPECESCRELHPSTKRLLIEYKDQLRVVVRYLPFHSNSRLAASALEESREFGKFEEALNLLFEKQPEWGSHSNPRPELIAQYLMQLGIDKDKLGPAYLLPKHQSKIDLDASDAAAFGITGTPTFYVNGKLVEYLGYGFLKAAIDEAILESTKEGP